jgi:hypothetical protein
MDNIQSDTDEINKKNILLIFSLTDVVGGSSRQFLIVEK